MTGSPDLAVLYRDTQARIARLVGALPEADLAAPVPACPGWSVGDVVSHLTAVVEDVMAGRLTRPPTDEQTEAQVARFAGTPTRDVIAQWIEGTPAFADLVGQVTIWPAVIDVVTHEHDIRGALGRPEARDTDAVRVAGEQLLRTMNLPICVACEGQEIGAGDLCLTTTWFEALRFRLGRRSRSQLAQMAWTGDPEPVLDQLVIFGPSPADIIE